jgi:GAF domain-containing protein
VVFPLIVGGQWLGVITGQGYTVLNLSEMEIRQLKSLTDQAATVIQTQRLFEQTQRNLDLTAKLFDAGRRLNAADSLQTAVAAIVEAIPLPAINRVLLLMFDRDAAGEIDAAVVAANWYSGVGTPPTPLNMRYPWAGMSTLNFALTTETFFFNDTYTDQRIDPLARQILERQNIRALAVLPLWVGSHQLGILLLEAEDIHHFTSDEIEPYTALAGQLAIAIDRQNLLEQTRTALAEAQTLYQTSQALVVANSLDQILRAVASTEIALGVAGISLLTVEVNELGDPEWATIAASWSSDPSGPASSLPIGTRFHLQDFPLSQLWISHPDTALLIGDVNHNENIDSSLEQMLQQSNVAAMALIPLMIRGGWIGLITLTWSTPQTFTEHHQRLFNSLALQAAVTVNNQLLLERTQADLVEQERLTADLDNQRSTLQAVLQSIPAGVFVAEAPTGRPLLSNQQAQEMLGRGIAPDAGTEELAQVYSAYRHGTNELYPPAEMPLVRGMFGEVTSVDDMEIRRPDGSRIVLQVFGAPIRDASGQITASVAIFQDVTERERAEAEREQLLAEVQAAYRQFVQREWNQFLGGSRERKLQVEHQQLDVAPKGNGHLQRLEDEVIQAGKLKAISAVDDHEPSSEAAIVAPISLRGQVIGTLSLQDIDPHRHWSDEEIALVETVSEQLAQTVENLRLFEETQKRATREQLTRQITDKMRALPDMDSIIETGLTELAKALGVSRTYVKLTSKLEQVEDTSHEIDAIRAQLKQHGHK